MITKRSLKARVAELEEKLLTYECSLAEFNADRVRIANELNCIPNHLVIISKLRELISSVIELKANAEKADVTSPMMPCPCCENKKPVRQDGCHESYCVWCQDCHMHGPEYETIEEAINAWNNLPRRRTT